MLTPGRDDEVDWESSVGTVYTWHTEVFNKHPFSSEGATVALGKQALN